MEQSLAHFRLTTNIERLYCVPLSLSFKKIASGFYGTNIKAISYCKQNKIGSSKVQMSIDGSYELLGLATLTIFMEIMDHYSPTWL